MLRIFFLKALNRFDDESNSIILCFNLLGLWRDTVVRDSEMGNESLKMYLFLDFHINHYHSKCDVLSSVVCFATDWTHFYLYLHFTILIGVIGLFRLLLLFDLNAFNQLYIYINIMVTSR